MTYISSVERIGMEKGLEKGMQQGLEQGMLQAQARMLRILARLLKQRFGDMPTWVTQRLEKANIDELEAWAEAVLSADSIDAVFRESRH